MKTQISTPEIEAIRTQIAAIEAEEKAVRADYEEQIKVLKDQMAARCRQITAPRYDLRERLQELLRGEVGTYAVGDMLEYEYERELPRKSGHRYSPKVVEMTTQHFRVTGVKVLDDGEVRYYGVYILKDGGDSAHEFVIAHDPVTHQKGAHTMKRTNSYASIRLIDLRKQGEPKPVAAAQ